MVLKAAQNLASKRRREPRDVMKALVASLDRSHRFDPIQKTYNVGATGRLLMTRNARGKVTLAFPKGLKGLEKSEVMAAVEKVWKELG